MIGLIGRKVGMTQIHGEKGEVLPVTVIEVGPCTVTEVRSADRNGYTAIQLGFGTNKEIRFTKPLLGQFQKRNLPPSRHLREFRVDEGHGYEVGKQLDATLFEKGERVDVAGVTRGRGFQGVRRRHKFNLGPRSHGSKNYRETKSTGQNTFPARRWPGKRMAGHMGDVRRTIRNLEVVGVDAERNYLMVAGPVPGWDTGLVYVRKVGALGKGRA